MKIRLGFVSNSSTSSFVVRGLEINTIKLLKMLNIDPDEHNSNDWADIIYENTKVSDLDIESGYSYENETDDEEKTTIIGKDIGYLEECSVFTIPTITEEDDNNIKEKLLKLLGKDNFDEICKDKKLQTLVWFSPG